MPPIPIAATTGRASVWGRHAAIAFAVWTDTPRHLANGVVLQCLRELQRLLPDFGVYIIRVFGITPQHIERDHQRISEIFK